MFPLHWRHNDHDGVSNHQTYGCLLNRLFRRRSKKTSKLCVTDLCVGNSPGPVNSPHKGPVTRKMFPFDDVTMHSDLFHWHRIGSTTINWNYFLTSFPQWCIYASVNCVTIGSVNGLSPIRRQALTWTNARLLSIRPLETNFSDTLIKIQNFSFKKMHLKLSSAKMAAAFCPGGDELKLLFDVKIKKYNNCAVVYRVYIRCT